MLPLLLSLVGLSLFACLFNWRIGLIASMVVAFAQEPLRKMTPDTPSAFTLAFLPAWMLCVALALYRRESSPRELFLDFPLLRKVAGWFVVYLAVPALLSATYGPGSWQITVLGVLLYSLSALSLVMGWVFAARPRWLGRLLAGYVLLGALMLIGGPIEALGLSGGHPAIGTEAMDFVWVTHRTGEAVNMVAGFFRGPDIMGWHAAMVFMISVLMAFRSRGVARIFWIGLAVWGSVNIWICGRRKMIAMIPIFLGILTYFVVRLRQMKAFIPILAILVSVIGFGAYAVSSVFEVGSIQRFYLSAFDEADEQLRRHGAESIVTTFKQSGFFGHGLGMAQQGARHIDVKRPRIWQESGPSKLMVELGVPGIILFLLLAGVLLLTCYKVVFAISHAREYVVYAGLLAILCANLTAAIVSAQIYGDPFIALLLSFIAGLILSGLREGEPLSGEVTRVD